MRIILKRFGKIPKEIENDIIAIVKECYEKIPHNIEIVDIFLFENLSLIKSFYHQEKEDIGVVTNEFEDYFLARHDAWRGISRIAICLEAMKKVPKLIQIGALRHEVAHSILHGSIEYYVFPVTKALAEASIKFNLSKQYCINLIYLISIAVKDFEATKLLLKNGFIEDQIAYLQYLLKPSNDDLIAWNLSKDNPAAIVLCLAGRLKDLACLTALRSTLTLKNIPEFKITESLSYIPFNILEKILSFINKLPQLMNNDTFHNFNVVMNAFIEDILKPIFIKL